MSLTLDDIKISKIYSKLVPSLLKEEYNQLKSSIRINGLYLPIIINAEQIILDGHNRFKICKELEIQPKFKIKKFDNILLEKKFVIECNLHRRHLNDIQKVQLGIPLQKINEELSKQKESDRKRGLSSEEESHNSNKETAQQIGVSKSTFERGKKILEEAPQVVEKIIQGKTTISKEYQKIQNEQKRRKRQEEIKKTQVNLPDTITLYNQDFVTASIKDNSVSLIFTDPPYHEKYLHLYDDLGKQAFRVLKDGGSLVTYAGHFNIQHVISEIEKHGLKFEWIFCILHSGPSTRIHSKKIHVTWKPMLYFSKGKYEGGEINDSVKSEYQGKDLHKWAQSTIESDYYIKQMTIENEIVYDPFMGQGTFGVSAANLNRQFIGCEIEKDHFENARRLISNVKY